MKKSQAAMEFLMTYGWAILIIMIVMAILFSLNIFNPRVPNSCISVSPITCYDIRLDESKTIQIVLSSSETDESWVSKIEITNPMFSQCTQENINGGSPTAYGISVDDKTILFCQITSETLNKNSNFEGNAEVVYKLSGGSNAHKVNIKFSGTIE